MNKAIVVTILSLSLGACSTITITPQGTHKIESAPAYSQRQSYYFWGLAGENNIDVKQVCGDKQAKQMQSQTTFMDGFLGVITLGIYSPRTAHVWCS